MLTRSILNSKYQSKKFVAIVLVIFVVLTLGIIYILTKTNQNEVEKILYQLLLSLLSSMLFAIFSSYILYLFFKDTKNLIEERIVLPKDIENVIHDIAKEGIYYKIYSRTARHFRSKTLNSIIEQAKKDRIKRVVDVYILDYRDNSLCKRYSEYRRNYSFDSHKWSTEYVKEEIISSILVFKDIMIDYSKIIEINIYLTNRLSVYRIEGSENKLIMTRENPKDYAYIVDKGHDNYSAYLAELNFIKEEATYIDNAELMKGYYVEAYNIPIFKEVKRDTMEKALQHKREKSPYGS